MKYAVPCATTLVSRNRLSQKEFEEMLESVKKGVAPKGEPEKVFKVAFAVCSAMAADAKKGIDEKIVRDYFWLRHDAVVDERFELMRDFDPVHCRTFPGAVKKAGKGKAIVKTSIGELECITDFSQRVKKGSFVVVHRGFVVEKVGKKTALEIAEKTKKFF
ncbi:MAG: hypothetical protein AABW85_05375 [archaeon]